MENNINKIKELFKCYLKNILNVCYLECYLMRGCSEVIILSFILRKF